MYLPCLLRNKFTFDKSSTHVNGRLFVVDVV